MQGLAFLTPEFAGTVALGAVIGAAVGLLIGLYVDYFFVAPGRNRQMKEARDRGEAGESPGGLLSGEEERADLWFGLVTSGLLGAFLAVMVADDGPSPDLFSLTMIALLSAWQVLAVLMGREPSRWEWDGEDPATKPTSGERLRLPLIVGVSSVVLIAFWPEVRAWGWALDFRVYFYTLLALFLPWAGFGIRNVLRGENWRTPVGKGAGEGPIARLEQHYNSIGLPLALVLMTLLNAAVAPG